MCGTYRSRVEEKQESMFLFSVQFLWVREREREKEDKLTTTALKNKTFDSPKIKVGEKRKKVKAFTFQSQYTSSKDERKIFC